MDRLTRFIRRHPESDEGFTLIELMVVVLIIGILVAIAVPTFLGARNGAENKAVESSLRNALTTAKVYYTNNNGYAVAASVTAEVTSFGSLEPSLSFITTDTAATLVNGNTVGVLVDTNAAPETGVCLVGLSKTGNFYAIMDTSTAGTYYYEGATAPATCSSTTFTLTNATTALW